MRRTIISSLIVLLLGTAMLMTSCKEGGGEGEGSGGSGGGGGSASVQGKIIYASTTIPVSGVLVQIDSITYTSGSDGYYILNNVPAGNKTITATKTDYDPFSQSISVPAGGMTLNIPMTSGIYTHKLDGTITDFDYGSALEGTTVTILNPDNSESGLTDVTDATGHYQISSVPQGTRTLSFASSDCYEAKQADVFIANFDKTFNATLNPLSIPIGTVIAEIPSVGQGPDGLTWDGTYLWYGNEVTNMIYRVNPSNGNILQSFAAPGSDPTGLAWDGSSLWCLCYFSNPNLYKLNPSNGSVISSYLVPAQSGNWFDLAWDGSYLWLGGGGSIYKINPSTGSIISSIPSPTGTNALGLAWDGAHFWVTISGGSSNPWKIYEIDSYGNILDMFEGTIHYGARGLAFDGNYLWAYDGGSKTNLIKMVVFDGERLCP